MEKIYDRDEKYYVGVRNFWFSEGLQVIYFVFDLFVFLFYIGLQVFS